NYTPYTDSGIFMIYLGTALGYADRSVNLVYKELKRLRENKLGVMQLSIAKQQFIGQLAISYESNLNDMLSIGKSLMHFNKVDTLEQIHTKIHAITAEDILETANEVFDVEGLSSLIYKNIEK
ncbi:MAG: insulinase family protein, partial [Bacteroidales bacterium]|nr:insulinase family protein [Bacteroidales bacterium]